MRSNFVLGVLTAAALMGGTAASAAVITVAPGAPTFSGMAVPGAPDSSTDRRAAAKAPVDAEMLTPAPEPETYALILAGLLFVGLRMRDQRR